MSRPSTEIADAAALVRTALARVLDVDPAVLRADTPLGDLRADGLAVLQTADLVEQLAAAGGGPVLVSDSGVLSARTVGDLVAAVEPVHVSVQVSAP